MLVLLLPNICLGFSRVNGVIGFGVNESGAEFGEDTIPGEYVWLSTSLACSSTY